MATTISTSNIMTTTEWNQSLKTLDPMLLTAMVAMEKTRVMGDSLKEKINVMHAKNEALNLMNQLLGLLNSVRAKQGANPSPTDTLKDWASVGQKVSDLNTALNNTEYMKIEVLGNPVWIGAPSTVGELDAHISRMKGDIDGAASENQTMQVELQNYMSKYQSQFEVASNMYKMIANLREALVRAIGS